jgi:hypothetical protein
VADAHTVAWKVDLVDVVDQLGVGSVPDGDKSVIASCG